MLLNGATYLHTPVALQNSCDLVIGGRSRLSTPGILVIPFCINLVRVRG